MKKEYMTGSELRQYLHISTRKLKYLMDHNYIPHEDTGQSTYKYRVLVKDARTFKRRMKCEPGFLSELSGLFTSTRPAGSPAPNTARERIDSAEFEKYLLLRWADLPDALPTLQAARLISVRPQRLYEQVRTGVLHSVTIGGKQYCAKVEIIACAASPERLANARGKAYMALIEDYLNKKI